jgi:hypothetical protein
MRRPILVLTVFAAPSLAASVALSEPAAPTFEADASAAIQDLAAKAAAQKITVVPQPEGLVVNGRMIYYRGPGQNIVGMSADEILTWSQQDLGGKKRD